MTAPTPALAAPRADVVARSVGDEMVLLDLASGTYYSLNGVGALIWRQLEERRSPAEIVEAVAEQYAIDQETARADAERFLAQVAQAGLLAG